MLYHVNDDGNVMPCSAKKKDCPFVAESHFDNVSDAQSYYENEMSKKNSPTIQKNQLRKKRPVKKTVVYHVGDMNVERKYFDDLLKVLQVMDDLKPDDRQGRAYGVFASPDLKSHSRWVLGKRYDRHEGNDKSFELTVDENAVYVYDVDKYEKASTYQNIYGHESEKFINAAKDYWDSGMLLSDWNEWAKESKPKAGTWEIIISPDAIMSSKSINNRKVIENSSDDNAKELNFYLEPSRARKGLIWRKNNLTDTEKSLVTDEALQVLNKDFVNDMNVVYSQNAYHSSDLHSAQKEIYSSILRQQKKRGEDVKTFASLDEESQRSFYQDVKTYVSIVEKVVEENKMPDDQ